MGFFDFISRMPRFQVPKRFGFVDDLKKSGFLAQLGAKS